MYWLIVARDGFRLRVCTVLDGDAMPIFSREREAASFVRASGLGGDWRTRETSLGELASLLLGPYADVSRILLDPPVGGATGTPGYAPGVERRTFVDHLVPGSRAGGAGVGADR